MSGPWERFQSSGDEGPWKKFAAPSSELSTDNVVRQVATGVPIVGGLLNKANAATYAALSPLFPSDSTVSQAPNWGERYAENLERENKKDKTFEADRPITSTGLQLAGGVAGTLPMVMAAPAAFGAGSGSLTARAGASALSGAALGGADAAARSGGDAQSTLMGSGLGLGLGGATPALASGIGKVASALGSKLKPGAVPSIEELEQAASTAFRKVDDAGIRIAQPKFSSAMQDIARAMQGTGLDETITPKSMAAIKRLQKASTSSPTIGEVSLLRQVASNAAGSLEKPDARIGSKIVGAVDDFVGGLTPGDLVSGDVGALPALKEARALWASKSKAEVIEDAIKRAENRAASSGSGGNVDNTIRQNIRSILDSPKKSRGFTDDERAALEKIVRDRSRVARALGKLSPSGSGLMTALHSYGGIASGGATLPLAAAGAGAKMIGDRATRANVAALMRTIQNGGTAPVSPLSLPARDGAEKVARALLSPAPLYANQQQLVR